jgi:predicted nuclease of restriction endonuclease-like (RecB) superfamily
MRKFYLTYKIAKSPISQSISWTHYLHLMRITKEEERNFYEIETVDNNWSVRELSRQISASLFERLSLSKDKKSVLDLSSKGQMIEKASDLIKDPYVLEFLNLEESYSYNETELEQALIDKLEHFLLELGKGFTFVGRQVRFTFDEEHFRVDLVFYNRLLKSFVLIDLKIGKLKHQDLGQMQMYVNYYDRFVKLEEENKTIGIILCKDKKDTMVEITLPENNNQIFASKYELILPSKKQLQQVIDNKSN